MADGELRVIEVVGGGARHAEAFHHAARTGVGGDGHRDDLGEAELTEGEVEGGPGGLGGITAAPVGAGQAPADLYARREVGLERRRRQADEADEGGDAGRLDRPEAEAAGGEVDADPLEDGVAL